MSHLNILLAEVLLAQTFMAIYVYLLTYFKKPAEVSKTIWIASAAAILVLNMLIVFLCGYHEAYRKIWAISLTLPYLIVTTLVSYHKLLQVLFNLLTVMYIACFSVLTGDIAFLLTGRAAYQLISHILCLAAGLILILRLRRPFLKASELLRKGWGALCCVPLTIVLICPLCISRVTYHGELIFSLIAYTALAAGACVYYMIYRFFIKVLEERQTFHFENLLKLRPETPKRI